MDRVQKKRLKAQWQADQRKEALAALPMPLEELKAMFDMLDVELANKTCDNSRQLAMVWMTSRGHEVARVCEWLDKHGGYCDCEILSNVEQHIDDISRD